MKRQTFACPDCGTELKVAGLIPGREVQCAVCGTAVEVPYLPREGGSSSHSASKRGKLKAPWLLRLAWVAAGILGVILVVGAVRQSVKSRIFADRESRVVELLASAASHERAGRLERALVESEAAVALLRSVEPCSPGRREEVARQRSRLSLREALRKLELLDTMEARRAVGECLTLRVRAESDPALADLGPTIESALDQARSRQGAEDLSAAEKAIGEGRPADALRLLEGLLTLASKLPTIEGARTTVAAKGIAARLVQRVGLNLSPVKGTFLLGSPESYATALGPALAEAARIRGYLARPAKSSFATLWETDAPYRLSIELTEGYGGYYLQSQSRSGAIHGSVTLTKRREVVWTADLTGRTRVPVEGMPAYLGSRLAVSDRREPEAEKRLYEDAFASFTEQVGVKLRGVPRPSGD